MTESTRQNIQPDDLKNFCTAAMVKAGLSQEDAALSAHVFVTTDTWGTFTHGTRQIRGLMQNARRGRLVATAKEKIVAEGPVLGHYRRLRRHAARHLLPRRGVGRCQSPPKRHVLHRHPGQQPLRCRRVLRQHDRRKRHDRSVHVQCGTLHDRARRQE